MYGSGYVLECVSAFYLEQQEELRYRHYVTEALRILTENTTRHVVQGYGEVKTGTYLQRPWYEPVSRSRPKTDTRTGDEVAAEVIKKLGLKFKERDDNNG